MKRAINLSMKNRTFLTTLTLFLLAFNLGISIIAILTLQDTVERAKERGLREHYIIVSALVKDFNAVQGRGVSIEDNMQSLLQPYNYFSGEKKTGFAFLKGEQTIYSNRMGDVSLDNLTTPPENGDRLVTLRKSGENSYVIVTGQLPKPYDQYTMVYLYNTTSSISSWSGMKNTLFVVGLILSILLASCLLLLLNRLFKPLAMISQTSRNIAAGAYQTRLKVSGGDELAEMAHSFNNMADEIQRQMEALTESAEQKQRFVDNFAHELRTPLTAIYGYAEYLQKAAISQEDRLDALGYILSECGHIQAMSYQLLELAKLRNDIVQFEPINTANLFLTVKQSLMVKLEGKQINLSLSCEIDTVYGDACLLENLLVNLVDNAIKACDTGGQIVLRAYQENHHAVISVQDNGKGMNKEVLQHITEPFYRAEKSRNRKDGGAGLGLSICRQICESHHATLEFISSLGQGTISKITFTTT